MPTTKLRTIRLPTKCPCLQAANDARDLNAIRQLTTPEMFAELQLAMAERATRSKEPRSKLSGPR